MWQWVVLFDAVQDSYSVWCIIQRLYAFSQLLHFVSWLKQIVPLMGSNGLDPVEKTINTFTSNIDAEYWDSDEEKIKNFDYHLFSFLRYPTLFWYNHSDFVLKLVCILGIITSLIIMLFLQVIETNYPILMIFLWWSLCMFNSSISQVSQVFGLKTESQTVEGSFTFGLANCFGISLWKPIFQLFLTEPGLIDYYLFPCVFLLTFA